MASLAVPGQGRLRSRRETVSREIQREASQRKAFTRWMNTYLPDDRQVGDLDSDLRDGSRLCALAESLCSKRGPKYAVEPQGDIQILNNHAVWMQVVRDGGCELTNIQSSEVSAGNVKITLALLWQLIVHFQLSRDLAPGPGDDPSGGRRKSNKSAKERLLEWVAEVTEGILESAPTNLHSDWSDGRAFLALVKHARPDVVDMAEDALSGEADSSIANLAKAFDLATEHLRIPALLDPADVAMNPDENAVATYVSMFRFPAPVVLRDPSLEGRLAELEKIVAALTKENSALKDALRAASAESEALRKKASEEKATGDKAESEARAAKEEVAARDKEIAALKEKLSAAEVRATLADQKVEHLEGKLSIIPTLEEQVRSYKAILADLESETEQTAEQVRAKEEALKRLEGESEALSRMMNDKDSEMSTLTERMEEFRRERLEQERLEAERLQKEREEEAERERRLLGRREEILGFFQEGCMMWKYTHGGRGKAHERYFRLDKDTLELSWTEKKDSTKGMKKVLVRGVHRGSTVVNNPPEHEALTFTIISPDYQGLSLRAKSSMAYAMFIEGIPMLIEDKDSGKRSAVPVPYLSAETGDVVVNTATPKETGIGRRSFIGLEEGALNLGSNTSLTSADGMLSPHSAAGAAPAGGGGDDDDGDDDNDNDDGDSVGDGDGDGEGGNSGDGEGSNNGSNKDGDKDGDGDGDKGKGEGKDGGGDGDGDGGGDGDGDGDAPVIAADGGGKKPSSAKKSKKKGKKGESDAEEVLLGGGDSPGEPAAAAAGEDPDRVVVSSPKGGAADESSGGAASSTPAKKLPDPPKSAKSKKKARAEEERARALSDLTETHAPADGEDPDDFKVVGNITVAGGGDDGDGAGSGHDLQVEHEGKRGKKGRKSRGGEDEGVVIASASPIPREGEDGAEK